MDDGPREFTMDLGILKDANALDRVRFNNLKIPFLRTYHAKCLIPLASQLYEKSEEKRRAGSPLFDSVMEAAIELELVRDA